MAGEIDQVMGHAVTVNDNSLFHTTNPDQSIVLYDPDVGANREVNCCSL